MKKTGMRPKKEITTHTTTTKYKKCFHQASYNEMRKGFLLRTIIVGMIEPSITLHNLGKSPVAGVIKWRCTKCGKVTTE